MKIEVCERLMESEKHKFHAQIKGRPSLWSCGDTIQEAIGNLILSHSKDFDLIVENLGKLPR